MKNDEKKISFLRRYFKTILHSIFAAFSTGFAAALWITTYKILDIKSGAYPDMPQNQIDQQYNEALPYLIMDSILICVVITIVVSIFSLFIRFKYNHNINIFREVMGIYVNHKLEGETMEPYSFELVLHEFVQNTIGTFKIIANYRPKNLRTGVWKLVSTVDNKFYYLKTFTRKERWHPEVYAYNNFTCPLQPYVAQLVKVFEGEGLLNLRQ